MLYSIVDSRYIYLSTIDPSPYLTLMIPHDTMSTIVSAVKNILEYGDIVLLTIKYACQMNNAATAILSTFDIQYFIY